MGRQKRRTQAKFRERKEKVEGEPGVPSGGRLNYALAPKESKLFEQYYKGQGIVPEADFDAFIKTLQQPLPATFRITGFSSHATEMLRIIKGDYLKDLVNIEIDGREIRPTKCLPWYPSELAWQLDFERKLIRQNNSLKRLHKFLVQETESGNISRQESVSMIPPLMLDVQPHHKVLDMCAAPGSKTAQLIEMLHAKESNGALPDGFVAANDNDNKRCYLMVHQIGRLASPNFVVMNMDASNLPNLHTWESTGPREVVKFDRILCDVPCSGDGTLRKNVDAWHRWNPNVGHGLHNLQVRILRRGLDLLSVGGRLVYSTCSFNPVENEAVLTHVLKLLKGSVELIDVSDHLPGLIREPGLHSWRVMTKQGEWFDKWEDVPERLHTQMSPSSFPPTEEEAITLGLSRCIRILPHKQDTGGFFVAVLHRRCSTKEATLAAQKTEASSLEGGDTVLSSNGVIASEGAEAGDPTVASEDTEVTASPETGGKRKMTDDDTSEKGGPYRKKARHFGYKEDPFIFLKQDDKSWDPVREFYGISESFPFDQLMVRCDTGKKRNIYFVSPKIKQLVQQNEDNFKFINLGVKILSRSISKGVDCEFRIVQDGLHILLPYISKRIVTFTKDDVVTLLSVENPFICAMSKTTQLQLEAIGQGGCVFVYEPDTSSEGPECKITLCGWMGKVSCRSFLPKNDRGHILRLCGVELKERGGGEENLNGDEDDTKADETNTDNVEMSTTSKCDETETLSQDVVTAESLSEDSEDVVTAVSEEKI